MKRLTVLLGLLAALPLAAEVRIASGDGILPVAVPASETLALKTAKAELVSYLSQITGRKFAAVVEATAPAKAIYLGPTKFAADHGIDLKSFGPDEWIIREIDGNLVLAGDEPRGTLYAVYHFLEDELGVRWLSPAPDGEVVPKRETLVLSGLDRRGKPAMPYRSIYVVPGADGERFLVRNRVNTHSPIYGGGGSYGGSQDCHTLYSNLGNKEAIRKLYAEHPEYFPLIDGKRFCDLSTKHPGGEQSQLCLTNPDLRDLWAEKLRERIRTCLAERKASGRRPPIYFAIDQNDCYDGFCKCDKCQEVVKREEGNAGLLLEFANYVAEKLESEAPGISFQMMALHSTEKPPKTLKARHNVSIRLCDTTSNILKPWTDPENAKHYNNLLAWKDHVDKIAMWDYSITYGSTVCVSYPTPAEYTFADDIRTLRDNKGDGFFFEHENPVTADMRDLKVWVELKLVENPDLDGNELIRTFTDLYYGPAAGAIVRAYRELLAQKAKAANARVTWFPGLSSYGFLDAETVSACYDLYAKALAAATDTLQRERVEHAFLSLDRLYIIKSSGFARYLKQAGKSLPLPDTKRITDRYCRVIDREFARRGYKTGDGEYKKNVDEFLKMVAARKELPVPPEFKDVPNGALFLFSTTMASLYFRPNKLVDDPSSPAGKTLRTAITDVLKERKYNLDAFAYPFKHATWPTMKGTVRGTMVNGPATKPEGYRWYKYAENVELKQDSCFAPFSGWNLPLEGVVSDNSELGQKYDIWASVKVEGPDYFATGKVTPENVFFVDQIAVVRKTLNSEK